MKTSEPVENPGKLAATPGSTETLPEVDIFHWCAQRLTEGAISGWFQGGSELGPRALGHRSIVPDPRSAQTRDRLNEKVKHRGSFRPFAPAVLHEEADRWFETARGNDQSPFMLRVWPVRPERRPDIAAVVHVDGSSRAQTVTRSAGRFHSLLPAFHRLIGVPTLVNTSFNVNGEPIVETPEDALWCFLMTDMDFCVLEDCVVEKGAGREAISGLCPSPIPEVAVALRRGSICEPMSFKHATPWGYQQRQLEGGVRPILRLVDGELTVREIASACSRDGIRSDADPGLVRLFASLRHRSVISFAEPEMRSGD